MKQEILDKMAAEVYNTRFCQSDFEHDLKSLEHYDGPFLWLVRINGTSLRKIDMSEIFSWKNCEATRFQLFRYMDFPICDFVHWNKSKAVKFFYYDGYALLQVTKDDIVGIWHSVFSKFYGLMKDEYKSEYIICNKPLEIRYASEEVGKCITDVLRVANDMSDNSLQQCFDLLSHYLRNATNHYIMIYKDSLKYSFGFTEYVNGERRMSGGIIFDECRIGGYWQIHT